MAWSRAALAKPMGLILTALLFFPAALSTPTPSLNISMPTEDGLSYGFHDHKCPALLDNVSTAVRAARRSDPGITAGLLRLTFNDCFPQGCDASILLTGPNSEQCGGGCANNAISPYVRNHPILR